MSLSPQKILGYSDLLKENLQVIVSSTNKEKISSTKRKMEETLRILSSEESTKEYPENFRDVVKEYCNSVNNILTLYLKNPSEDTGEDSLLNLLSSNSDLRIKVIQELQLCSEPDWD